MIDPISGLTTQDPTAAPTSIVPNTDILGKDDFLKLLVTQLRTQDPLSPMDGQQMAVQLAQFSSVEQLMVINEGIEAQAAASTQMLGMLSSSLGSSMVGKEVLAAGDNFNVPSDALARFDLQGPGTVTLALIDRATGAEVANQPLGSLEGGIHEIDAAALSNGLPDGDYQLQVTATDSTGLNTVLAHPLIRFVVDGIRFGANGVVLTGAGGVEAPLGHVVEVNSPTDPGSTDPGAGANTGTGSSGS